MVDLRKGEYLRGDAYGTTMECHFSILKRGITGTLHHVSEHHLGRYLQEFDLGQSERSTLGVDDASRAKKAIAGTVGKRLTHRDNCRTQA